MKAIILLVENSRGVGGSINLELTCGAIGLLICWWESRASKSVFFFKSFQ